MQQIPLRVVRRPASSTDGALVKFNGTDGEIKDSGWPENTTLNYANAKSFDFSQGQAFQVGGVILSADFLNQVLYDQNAAGAMSWGSLGKFFTSNFITGDNTLCWNASIVGKFQVTYDMFLDPSNAFDIEIANFPKSMLLQGFIVRPTVAFTGGTLASYTLSIGIAGNLTKFTAPKSVFTLSGLQKTSYFDVEDDSAAFSMRINAVSVGDTLDNATAGAADIFIIASKIDEF